MKVAALLMNAVFADVDRNLAKLRAIVEQAREERVELLVLPEFCSSAIGYSPLMLRVPGQGARVLCVLRELAARHRMLLAGSWLHFDGGDAYNAFRLIFPDGRVFTHRKDIPTQFENCYYTRGDTDHILHTPIGDIGVALCWEMLRWDTVRRLSGKAEVILAGSCWWDLPVNAPPEREPMRKYNQALAMETPVVFSRLLHTPVIHAAHCGEITTRGFPDGTAPHTRRLVGAAQIIDREGGVLEMRPFDRGEGLCTAELPWSGRGKPAEAQPDRYWIPELPEDYLHAWETLNPKGEVYYRDIALPWYAYSAYNASCTEH